MKPGPSTPKSIWNPGGPARVDISITVPGLPWIVIEDFAVGMTISAGNGPNWIVLIVPDKEPSGTYVPAAMSIVSPETALVNRHQ
ncbi:hypothetical protein MYX76_08275 [Desulfobacterota bacterium AH_259_B03_O07]|nr:hypothetical protein [Desulfobacterota bacterium AH_259_B03_O07]